LGRRNRRPLTGPRWVRDPDDERAIYVVALLRVKASGRLRAHRPRRVAGRGLSVASPPDLAAACQRYRQRDQRPLAQATPVPDGGIWTHSAPTADRAIGDRVRVGVYDLARSL